MDYIVASTAVTDEIRFPGGKRVEKVAGGAGIYALCGIKLWCDQVLLVTGVGRDYPSLYGEWHRRNGISMEGLVCKEEKTPHNLICYQEDGERTETPLYGESHYQKIQLTPGELAPYLSHAKGIYIFKNASQEFWGSMLPILKNSRAAVMWEVASDAALPQYLGIVRQIASQVHVLSINLAEAKRLFGVETLEEAAGRLGEWGLDMVFLRQGAKGAVMVTPKDRVYVPPVKGVLAVDPTGGGNSSSGSVLHGYCQGKSPRECGLMGSIGAALCISQHGVPRQIGKEERRAARKLLAAMKEEEVEEKHEK